MPTLAALSLCIVALQGQTPTQAFDSLRLAVGGGSPQKVQSFFRNPADARMLLQMAGRRGGLRRIGVKVIPAPPGWGALGDHWAIFHTFQDLQQDHDVVHPFVRTSAGFKLEPAIPVWATQAARTRHARIDGTLLPNEKRVDVKVSLDLTATGLKKALVFRLNDGYKLASASAGSRSLRVLTATDEGVLSPKEGDVVRAGGLLIPWSTNPIDRFDAAYSGVLDQPDHDKISPNVAYVTAHWVPSLAYLPFTTTTRVQGPSGWVLRSEGVPVAAQEAGFPPTAPTPDLQTVHYKCDLPISFPKIIGGNYTLAAELKRDGKTYRSWHLQPQIDSARGQRDVKLMADSIAFFERTLGPFPFPGYECFDADTYYGIESYSYTLLQRGITSTFMAHEAGHTYFGGMAPSAYTKDTWNEGVTQYYDSVVYRKNSDASLQGGLRTVALTKPLSEMAVAWDNGSASYFRGAFVMKMLENEIGLDAVTAGLKALTTERRGRETTWPDLRQYFERAAGRKLDWFWGQWVTNGVFPNLSVVEARVVQVEQRFRTRVVVRQSGTPAPFRLRFAVRVSRAAQNFQSVVTMDSPEAVFELETPWEPREAALEVFPYALVKAGSPAPVRR